MKRLEKFLVQDGKRLRFGYTTGTCAAAAAKAAAWLLLGGEEIAAVEITVQEGTRIFLDLERIVRQGQTVTCTVQKDGGDDPDVTDGALISATVTKVESGFSVEGGAGVGRVTLPGLPCPVGQAAINPAPKAKIFEELRKTAQVLGYSGGLHGVISVERGAEIARKTFNPRLGIAGGISILGTTGLVEPMSTRALLATIELEINAWKAREKGVLLLTPGNYGRAFLQQEYGLDSQQTVKCSNFIGEALDYAVYAGFQRIVLVGHAGKLVKVAGGIMNTHSRTADCRMEILAAHAAMVGASAQQVSELMACVTVDAAHGLLQGWGMAVPVWDSVGRSIQTHLQRRVGDACQVSFLSFIGEEAVVSWNTFPAMLAEYRRENGDLH